jgi:hypothetical protein
MLCLQTLRTASCATKPQSHTDSPPLCCWTGSRSILVDTCLVNDVSVVGVCAAPGLHAGGSYGFSPCFQVGMQVMVIDPVKATLPPGHFVGDSA